MVQPTTWSSTTLSNLDDYWYRLDYCTTTTLPPPTVYQFYCPSRNAPSDPLKLEQFLLYYESIGRARQLARAELPQTRPRDLRRASRPSGWCHQQRCPDRRPRLSLLARIK